RGFRPGVRGPRRWMLRVVRNWLLTQPTCARATGALRECDRRLALTEETRRRSSSGHRMSLRSNISEARPAEKTDPFPEPISFDGIAPPIARESDPAALAAHWR